MCHKMVIIFKATLTILNVVLPQFLISEEVRSRIEQGLLCTKPRRIWETEEVNS